METTGHHHKCYDKLLWKSPPQSWIEFSALQWSTTKVWTGSEGDKSPGKVQMNRADR